MPANRIWVGQDADVLVYASDIDGNRKGPTGHPWVATDGSLLLYCLLQNTTLSGNLPAQRRPVTGRPQLRIVNQAYEYELDVEHFYLKKSTELNVNDIFNREKSLELVLRLQAYDDINYQEPHTLYVARAVQFTISEQDNENVKGKAKFLAERFV